MVDPRREGSRAEKERIVLRFRNQFLWFNFYGWTSSLIYGAVQPRPSCPPTPPPLPSLLERLSTFYWVDQFLCNSVYTQRDSTFEKYLERVIQTRLQGIQKPDGIRLSISIPSSSLRSRLAIFRLIDLPDFARSIRSQSRHLCAPKSDKITTIPLATPTVFIGSVR